MIKLKDFFRCSLIMTLIFTTMIISAFIVSHQLLSQSLAINADNVSNTLSKHIHIKDFSETTAQSLANNLALSMLKLETTSVSSQWQPENHSSILFEGLFPNLKKRYSGATDQISYEYKINFSKTDKHILSQLVYFVVAATFAYILSLLAIWTLLKRIEKRLLIEVTSNKQHLKPTFPAISQLFAQQKSESSKELQAQHEKIELLSKQINLDNLTGLYNRFYFRGELSNILNKKKGDSTAIVALIRATSLNHINKHRGYQFGDSYLKDLSALLQQSIRRYPDCQLYRISGPDFALIIPKMTTAVAHKLAKEIKLHLDEYQNNHDLESVAYIGITNAHSGQEPEQILARADTALAKAQVEGVNHWAFQQHDDRTDEQESHGESYWKQTIEEVIKKQSMMLLSQPVQPIHRNMKSYQEIYIRFIGNNNALLPTDTFFAMAQRLDLTIKTDQMIIDNIIRSSRTQMDNDCYWGVNLASPSVQSSSFIIWLERLLLREPNIAANLVFEIDESVLEKNIVASKRAIDMLRRVGCRSAISKFGHGISSFKLFKELKPNYIKMDSNLIQNINGDTASQQFLRMIVDVAHRMGCQVIAEGVEEHSQKQLLESMYVDAVQGYLIARPAPMKKIAS